MNLVVALEHHFHRTSDGAVWTQALFPYSYWTRYLAVFEHVRVTARVREVSSVPSDWVRADGKGVSLAGVPDYLGPRQYLLRAWQVQAAVNNSVDPNHAVILYLHGQIAWCVESVLRRSKHPYGAYIIADPYEAFTPGAIRHSLRPFFRWWFTQQLRRQCANACAVAYVTEHALQRRYPPSLGAFSTYFAMGDMPDEAFVRFPRPSRKGTNTTILTMVGSLAHLYKGPDVAMDAVAECLREGLDLRLVLIGDGKLRAELEARAASLGLKDRICFLGQLTAGVAVRTQLDDSDLYIMPSRTEGLPRAMIEAMARGLPCIGSTAGGIPELLLPEDMVPPGDATALARKIREVVTDPARMVRMAARNLEKAKQYRDEAVRDQRIAFYRYVREKTEAWLRSQRA